MRSYLLPCLVAQFAACAVPPPDPSQVAVLLSDQVLASDSQDPLVALQPAAPDVGDCLELPRDAAATLDGVTLVPLSLGGRVRQPERWGPSGCAVPSFARPDSKLSSSPDEWSLVLTGGGSKAVADFGKRGPTRLERVSPEAPLRPGGMLELRYVADGETLVPEKTSLSLFPAGGEGHVFDGTHGGLVVDGNTVRLPIREGYCAGMCDVHLDARATAQAPTCDFARCVLERAVRETVELEFLP